MKAALLLACVVLAPAGSLVAQDVGPCSSAPARAFDFWIGEWRIEQDILQQDGSWLTLDARTTVSPALDGCALIEHWQGAVHFFWEGMQAPEPMKGLSVRSYDPEAGQWSIHWMDTRSPAFRTPYVGGFEDGRGTFYREVGTPQGVRRDRITFSEITPDAVDWELAVSSDEGRTWSAIWIMKMRRSGSSPGEE